jgi:hypothetical protein
MNFDLDKIYFISKIEENKKGSISLNYWAQGFLQEEPQLNRPILMLRISNINNPAGKLGYFHSSLITQIIEYDYYWEIKTLNSVYRLSLAT